jgi:hypothetical protein
MNSLKILDSIQSIENKVNKVTAELINKKIKTHESSIQSKAKAFAVQSLLSQPEIASLSGGELAGAFGLTASDAVSAIGAISQSFSNSIYVKIQKFNKNLKDGGVYIYFQPSNFANLLSLSEGHVVYSKGDLHWLQWLLQRGDEIIVAGYQFEGVSGRGRSGLGYMTSGGAFRVPPQYSGTVDNNFVSRALIGSRQENILSQILMDVLK